MQWNLLYGSARGIGAEASWMLDKLRELDEGGEATSSRIAEARSLVQSLDHAASNELLIEVRNLWDALVVAPVAEPAPGSDPLPAPPVSAQRILDLLNDAIRPIGELIEDLNASEADGRLSMLLMAGMTGVLTATKAVEAQVEEILRGGES